MQGPEGFGGFSHGGKSYEPNAKGQVIVDADAIEAARSHGLKVIGSVEDKKPEPTKEELLEKARAELKDKTIEQLRALYHEKLGKSPSKSMKEDEIIDALLAE
jgi:hypothetical protein